MLRIKGQTEEIPGVNQMETFNNTTKVVKDDLMKKIPKRDWVLTHHRLIFFGRYQCTAKNPKCDICPVQAYCKYYKETYGTPKLRS